jgi:pimeloyl-ACP methyl ester carboxylesterase
MKIRLKDGAELFCAIDDFTDPWLRPETVVLHHGMAKNHRLWYAWVPILARHFRVVRFDARGMGQSTVPEPTYPWSLESFAEDILELLDQLEMERVHLIGETVGGTISLRFASLYPERLLSLTTCTSPIDFSDPHHLETADLVERQGVRTWVERTITRRLDPQMADPAFIRWYADQMAATAPHVVSGFLRASPGVTLRPLLTSIQTPTLVLAAERLQGEVLGDFRKTADLLPHGKLVVFPGVIGFVQHLLPVPCGRVWLDFAKSLSAAHHA